MGRTPLPPKPLPRELSQYGKRMQFLSARIFGEPTRQYDPKTASIVRRLSEQPFEKQERWNENYFPPAPMFHHLMGMLRHKGLYRDEHLDFKELILRLKALRGKAPPMPGQGKRAIARGEGR